MDVPAHLLDEARRWADLRPWDRAELGRALRRLGLSYGEIRALLPVPKGTLAGWCREVMLTADQITEIRRRMGSQQGVPRDTQRRRRIEIEQIREQARGQAAKLSNDPAWVAGVALYWAEGFKTGSTLGMANSDYRILRLFLGWARTHHEPEAEFNLKINLHADNDEMWAKQWWRDALALPEAAFYKTFIKPDGTGHRKNHLPQGVCMVRMRRSADAFHRTFGWIEGIADLFEAGIGAGTMPQGR